MGDTKMPVNLTFATGAYRDNELIRYAYAFEQAHKGRTVPGRTPALPTDEIPARVAGDGTRTNGASGPKLPPGLTASAKRAADASKVEVSGSIKSAHSGGLKSLQVFVDGVQAASVDVEDGDWAALVEPKTTWNGRAWEKNVPDPNLAMIVVLAVANNGRAAGKLLFA